MLHQIHTSVSNDDCFRSCFSSGSLFTLSLLPAGVNEEGDDVSMVTVAMGVWKALGGADLRLFLRALASSVLSSATFSLFSIRVMGESESEIHGCKESWD